VSLSCRRAHCTLFNLAHRRYWERAGDNEEWHQAGAHCVLLHCARRSASRARILSRRLHIICSLSLGCIHQLNALFHKCRERCNGAFLIQQSEPSALCSARRHRQHPSLYMCMCALTISSLHFKLFALNLTAAAAFAARTSIIYCIPSFPATLSEEERFLFFCGGAHFSLFGFHISHQASKLEMPFIEIER
jgi:hypothetical protein